MPSRTAVFLAFTVALSTLRPSYGAVPTPRPVPSSVRVGCYYFPGHFSAARWSPIKAHGRPKPLLGTYRDGMPEVSDWHIKWAVEHTISFFVFDWYYDHVSARISEHNAALETGFLRAKHRGLMSFALMWCNEESRDAPPYTRDQMLALGRTLARYFREPNYLRIGGRPVVVISRPGRLIDSFGDDFRELNAPVSSAAGLSQNRSIFFVALASTPDPQLERMGFSATTAYNYAGTRTAKAGSRLRATYDDMIITYERIWRKMRTPGALPYIVPLSPGWDSRPWYGAEAFVRTGSSPTRFRDMCERSIPYVDPRLNMVLVECWNEFGEGSAIEPCEEHGFGYLHAIRDTFATESDVPRDSVPDLKTRSRLCFKTVPPGRNARARTPQAGNLLADPGMEEGTGWLTYSGVASRYVTHTRHGGQGCIEVRPGEGCKPVAATEVVYGRTYAFSCWANCAPGGRVLMRAALFGRQGKWLGDYESLDETTAHEWTCLQHTLPISRTDVHSMKLELVAEGSPAWVDDASLTVATMEPPPRVAFSDPATKAVAWVTYDGSPATCRPDPSQGRHVLAVPAAQGIKTRSRCDVAPGEAFRLTLRFRSDPLATAVFRCAGFGDDGRWLPGTYVLEHAVSWQQWIEVETSASLPEDSPVRSINVECLAEGGEVRLADVQLAVMKRSESPR